MTDSTDRDIIVVGSSMGGVTALRSLAASLPAGLPASVLVVQHTSAESPGLLAELLDRAGPLPAAVARHGVAPERGRIYVAPVDRHLLLTGQGMRVVFGARENRCRPAIDPLFRTAAVHYRSRVIGVVLTGLLGDGAVGLRAVERCGGVPLVQAPDDAAYPDMPRTALTAVPGARTVPLAELGPLLAELASQPAPAPPPVPEMLRIEARLTEGAMPTDEWAQMPGRPTDFTCPDCNGMIREIDGDDVARYRCRVGHAFGADVLVAAKDDSVEASLWIALQTLQERVQMLETMARSDRQRGWSHSAAQYDDRLGEARDHADRLRQFIARLGV